MNTAILVLAAGSSSRMGQSKQLLLVDGEMLIQKAVKVATNSQVDNVYVVLGANEQANRSAIQDFNVKVVFNPEWRSGIGSSIKAGVRFILSKNQSTQAILIIVCDQPLLTTDHLNNLINVLKDNKHTIAASRYNQTPGVPALFAIQHFNSLTTLDDSDGAKKIIQQHMATTVCVDFDGGEADLDTYQEYMDFLKRGT